MIDLNKQHGTHPVKHRVIRALRRSRDPARAVADTLSETLFGGADQLAESTFASVTDILRSAIDGAVEAGVGLADVAKGVSVGVIRGTRETGGAAQKAFSHAARTIVYHTAKTGGDIAAAARGVVQGAIQNAKALGLDAATSASCAAQSVIDAAGDIGTAAAQEVRQSLSGTIDGIRVALRRPISERDKN